MPLVTAGLIMGGVSAGLSIIGGKQQAAINAAVAQNQQAWANAQANWSNLQMMFGTVQKNMDIAGARAATLRQNRAIASAANYNRAMAETGLRRQSDAMSVNISRGTNAALDRLATRSLGAGISHNSGTYKRLKNLIDEQGKEALVTLAQNTSSKKKEILQTQANALATRAADSQGPAFGFAGPTGGGVTYSGETTFVQDLAAGLGGFSQGLQIASGLGELGVGKSGGDTP